MQPVIGTMSISLDGVGAGRNQTEDRPFGDVPVGVLHRWMFEAPEESRPEIDLILGAGAYVMGRNMFGPVRGEWDRDWRGWWGPNPPYHTPVFVLTHHPHDPIEMEGGTTFHFVTDGIHAALDRARDAAGDLPVHIAGGVSTLNAYLRAGLVDELRLQIAPCILGEGLRPFEGLSDLALEPIAARGVPLATHVRYRVLRSGLEG
ncbi:dihydrofolate reductase family protein [Microbacterium sp. NPDC056003]|uniref:dihydrofolate reductase family protein n=1 Tax=Microbacterium sp. NPDC056003 TaxID=3345676 RepID=UPI0035D8E864